MFVCGVHSTCLCAGCTVHVCVCVVSVHVCVRGVQYMFVCGVQYMFVKGVHDCTS